MTQLIDPRYLPRPGADPRERRDAVRVDLPPADVAARAAAVARAQARHDHLQHQLSCLHHAVAVWQGPLQVGVEL
jgi:hypothetical protein